MSDEADIANELMQQMIDVGVKNAHNKVQSTENETGHCIWCERPVKDKRRWCSVECRNEFEKYAK
jgi:hypothetical protein